MNWLIWLALLGLCLGDTTESNDRVKVTIGRTTTTRATTQTTPRTTTIATSLFEEDSGDESPLKFMLTRGPNNSFYDVAVALMGNGPVGLRLDIAQPDVFVMDGDSLLECDELFDWYDEAETSEYTNEWITTRSEVYVATVCYTDDAYFAPTGTSATPTPTKLGLYNGLPYTIQYPSFVEASGYLATDEFAVLNTHDELVVMDNFTFLVANDLNVEIGGLGLAGNPIGLGFLDSLKRLNLIDVNGYSLFFSNNTENPEAKGQLLPGMVDTKYISGSFYSFDMLPYVGLYDDINNSIKLPTIQLDDFRIENANNGDLVSLNSKDDPIALILDTRSYYTFLPLNSLINLAVQLNAVYSTATGRWIVECDQIKDSNANVVFVFGDLLVRININKYMEPAYWDGDLLKFSSGTPACFLSFFSSAQSGFYSLGLPFLEEVYMAVNNEAGKIALGNINKNFEYTTSFSDDGEYSTLDSMSAYDYSSRLKTIASMRSNNIPLATPYNRSTTATFTFNTNQALASEIPAQLSGAIIRLGEVYLTGYGSQISTKASTSSDASAATSHLSVGLSVKSMGEMMWLRMWGVAVVAVAVAFIIL